MPALRTHPVGRFIAGTALANSLVDWTLFATLVVTVDHLIGGGTWATALVLLARILPGVVLAPLAARRIDRRDLRTSLIHHELLRTLAVVTVAGGFLLASVVMAITGLLALEFAAAMQAAGRESVISRHVPRHHFTRLNTITAVASYGLLPIGPLLVALVGPTAGWWIAILGYAALAVAYRVGLHPDTSAHPLASCETALIAEVPAVTGPSRPEGTGTGGWMRVTIAAALGLLPAVALFTLGPSLADAWLGDRAATGPLYMLVLSGGAIGFALANRQRFRADLAMVLVVVGLGLALVGPWVPGLLLVGVGAGGAYLDLQTRLQHAASDPSQFAAAFAVLKATTAIAVAAAPALLALASMDAVLVAGLIAGLAGALVAWPRGGHIARLAVRTAIEVLLRAIVRVQVIHPDRRVTGPAVVVSNHPHWLDGPAAMLADRSLCPVARHQSHLGVRLGIWAAGAVVTGRRHAGDCHSDTASATPKTGTVDRAVAHLRAGGRIWLAPEGGTNPGRRLNRLRTGAVRMAAEADVPIQPLGIRWADGPAGADLRRWRPWRRRTVEVTWGDPLIPTGDTDADIASMSRALATAAGLPPPTGSHLVTA